jgi:type IV pilus biogenesis protein CpaD/CtpE
MMLSSRIRTATKILMAMFIAGALAGCSDNDPLNRPGSWRESAYGGAVMHDLRAEIADPSDLSRGKAPPPGDHPFSGQIAKHAIGSINQGGNFGGGAGNGIGGGMGDGSMGGAGMGGGL